MSDAHVHRQAGVDKIVGLCLTTSDIMIESLKSHFADLDQSHD